MYFIDFVKSRLEFFVLSLNNLIFIFLLFSYTRSNLEFRTDKQLERNFHENKPAISRLVDLCKTLKEGGVIKTEHLATVSLFTCPISGNYQNDIGVKESSQDLKGSYYIFMTDLDKHGYADIFIQEKGYIYFVKPPQPTKVIRGSLDQFVNKDLFVRKGIQEEWRYKKIEGNWYLYYRQYYQTFLP